MSLFNIDCDAYDQQIYDRKNVIVVRQICMHVDINHVINHKIMAFLSLLAGQTALKEWNLPTVQVNIREIQIWDEFLGSF